MNSHVVFLTGQITPVRTICDLARSRNIECIVDGAHSFAHLDFALKDVQCDYFGSSLHKWLYAPKGTGLLFIKREKIEKVWPLMAAEQKQRADIRKFEEIGTHSAAMRLAIGEAILFHQGVGSKRKEARLRYLRGYWADKLKNLPNGVHTSFDADSRAESVVKIVGRDSVRHTYLMITKIFTVPHWRVQGNRSPEIYNHTANRPLRRSHETIASKGCPKRSAADPNASRLWEMSEQLTGVRFL